MTTDDIVDAIPNDEDSSLYRIVEVRLFASKRHKISPNLKPLRQGVRK